MRDAHRARDWRPSLCHVFKFGGEQRFFFNNFFQPNPPTGFFHFSTGVTEQVVGGGNPTQGNSFASLLLGYGDTDSFYAINHSVANKSKETAFYVQDDWKISSKLTLNLGLRYEWSTPYSERHNQIQFSNFNGDSGIAVPFLVVGLIAAIRRVLVITAEFTEVKDAPTETFNTTMIELGLLTVLSLVLVVSLVLLRRRPAMPTAER